MENEQNKPFCGYARESIDLVSGIKIQEEAIKKYAEYAGLDCTKIYKDNNRSAFKERPQFNLLWSRLDQYQGIIVSSLDRFGRDFGDLITRLNGLKDNGKTLICIRENINSSNAESEFFLRLLALFAERERTITRERLAAGLLWARENGTKSGKPCHRPEIQVDWREYDKWAVKGLSVSSIAKFMNMNRSTLYDKVRYRTLSEHH
jgi:DNA invertase Pin-like site-specific DNA recombinase